jgi:hypothetical protein
VQPLDALEGNGIRVRSVVVLGRDDWGFGEWL